MRIGPGTIHAIDTVVNLFIKPLPHTVSHNGSIPFREGNTPVRLNDGEIRQSTYHKIRYQVFPSGTKADFIIKKGFPLLNIPVNIDVVYDPRAGRAWIDISNRGAWALNTILIGAITQALKQDKVGKPENKTILPVSDKPPSNSSRHSPGKG